VVGPCGPPCHRGLENCFKVRAALDKLKADPKFAFDTLKVDATPTLFHQRREVTGARFVLGSDQSSNVSHFAFLGVLQRLRRCNETDTDAVFLDPGDAAFADRGVLCHHEAEARGNKGWIRNLDGRALERNIPHHAAHDGTACRYKGRLVNFGPWVLPSLFHGLLPWLAWVVNQASANS